MIPPNLMWAVMVGYGAYCLLVFVLLSVSLYMMLRVQDLNYTIPGILISSALASICYVVPIIGKYFGGAVLFFCVKRMTQAEFIDIRFTVLVSYAVTFLLQMVIFSALPDHHMVRARDFINPPPNIQMTGNANLSDNGDDGAPIPSAAKPKTSYVSPTAPKTPVFTATNDTPAQIAAKTAAKNTTTTATNVAMTKSADYAKTWKLKGVVGNGPQAIAMIGVGKKTYSFGIGDKLKVDTGNGKVDVSLEAATQTYVLLDVDGVGVTLNLK